jgi:uncharacterized protein YndB with AHSA1/START domain
MKFRFLLAAVIAFLPVSGMAEVKLASPSALLIEHRYSTTATPAAAWQVLVHPELYWPSDHTWSGDARNMSLDPVAAGCFCERWPSGSADHGRVVMAVPGERLRILALLGPFQELAVSGVLTVVLSPKADGTEATVTYRVSGDDSHKLDAMAPIVDKVIGLQFAGFARLAGSSK